MCFGIVIPDYALALAPGDVIEDGSPIFTDTSAAFAPNGFGAPSMSWDARLNRWVAILEYQSAATDPACPHGIWGLALSTTTDPDGASGWTAPQILFEPSVDGSYRSCVAAHPATLWLYSAAGTTNNRRLIVLFKAETDTTVAAGTCPVGVNINDCTYTGIGRLGVVFNVAGNLSTTSLSGSPAISITEPFGFQSPIQQAGIGQYLILVQKEIPPAVVGGPTTFGIYSTTATNPNLIWSPLTLVQSPGADSWNQDELFNPEITCSNTPGELISFQGGRTWGVGTSIVEAGWSEMSSVDNGVTWTLGPTPIVTWFDNYDWRHWTFSRVGPDDYFIWFVRKNAATNHLEIHRAEALGTGTVGTPIDRRCL
ncbi:MAG: hypothetical protein AAB776_02465, partial [Patescibacteria group bacterium]